MVSIVLSRYSPSQCSEAAWEGMSRCAPQTFISSTPGRSLYPIFSASPDVIE